MKKLSKRQRARRELNEIFTEASMCPYLNEVGACYTLSNFHSFTCHWGSAKESFRRLFGEFVHDNDSVYWLRTSMLSDGKLARRGKFKLTQEQAYNQRTIALLLCAEYVKTASAKELREWGYRL